MFTIIEDGKRTELDHMLKICSELGFSHVPMEERGFNLPTIYPNVEALLSRAEGEYPYGGRKGGEIFT